MGDEKELKDLSPFQVAVDDRAQYSTVPNNKATAFRRLTVVKGLH